jgi:hypothetical protein
VCVSDCNVERSRIGGLGPIFSVTEEIIPQNEGAGRFSSKCKKPAYTYVAMYRLLPFNDRKTVRAYSKSESAVAT